MPPTSGGGTTYVDKMLASLRTSALRCPKPAVWALLAASLAAFLALPLAAQKCFLDEKALLVGGALPTVRLSGALDACLATHAQLAGSGKARSFVTHVRAAAAATEPFAGRLDFHLHAFNSSSRHGPGSSKRPPPRLCRTLHTVVRAPRGDGGEGFVLALPLNPAGAPAAAALAAAAGVAAAGHLRRAGWLAKDFVLLFVDAAACSAEESAEGWVAAYAAPGAAFSFPRTGLLQQALVMEVSGPGGGGGAIAHGGTSSAEVAVHGAGGALPNLDLFFLIKRNLDLHTTLPTTLRAPDTPLPAALAASAAALATVAAATGLAPPAAAQRHASALLALAGFAAQQASGRPTGGHGPFLARGVAAATLTLRLSAAGEPGGEPTGARGGASAAQAAQRQQAGAANALQALEMVLRTLSGLQERLHHSTAMYALLSPTRCVPAAAYLAAPACAVLAALAQLVLAGRAAAGAGAVAWRLAWRRAAACHAVAAAAAAVAQAGGATVDASSAAVLAGRLLAAAAMGVVVAAGLPAAWEALRPDAGTAKGGSGGSCSRHMAAAGAAQATAATGLVGLVLQAAHLLLGSWARCLALLLLAVPLYALRPAQGGRRGLAVRGAMVAGGGAVAWRAAADGAPWLARLLLPHLLLLACVVS